MWRISQSSACGKGQGHRGALPQRTLQLQGTSSPAHRGSSQGQPDAAATPLVFGRKQRLFGKRQYSLIHPRTGVLDSHQHLPGIRRSAADSHDAAVTHGIEGVEHRIRAERVLTPVEWENEQRIYLGATFNLAHNLGQMLSLRPHNRFEDLDSVYLVGGGTHPGSGLPVIFESARISSRLLLNDFGMDSAWLAPDSA